MINQSAGAALLPRRGPDRPAVRRQSLAPDIIKEIVGVVDDVREAALDSATLADGLLPVSQTPDSYVRPGRAHGACPRGRCCRRYRCTSAASTATSASATSPRWTTRIEDSPAAYLRRSARPGWSAGSPASPSAQHRRPVRRHRLLGEPRTREIGVRMALGASRAGRVYRLVIRRSGCVSAALGVALGLAGALALAVPLRQLLFETSAFDAATLGAVATTSTSQSSRATSPRIARHRSIRRWPCTPNSARGGVR